MNIHKIILPTPYPIGDVNAFLVKGEALTLFDAGPKTKEAYEVLEWGIRAAGYDMTDVEQVVLTHHHPDHAGWVDAFPNAQILGHEYVDHWMRKEEEFLTYRDEFYRTQLQLQGAPEEYIKKTLKTRNEMEHFGTTPLTSFLEDGDEVPGHPGMKAYYTPGHAQSHLIFLDSASNTAIGGDLLLEKVASNPLVEPPVDLSFERPKSLLQYQDSLRMLRNLHISKLYTGHGNEIENVEELVTDRLERDRNRAIQVLELLNEPKTVMDITREIYAALYKKQLGLTLSKTLGQLDYLVEEGYVTVELIDRVNYYTRQK